MEQQTTTPTTVNPVNSANTSNAEATEKELFDAGKHAETSNNNVFSKDSESPKNTEIPKTSEGAKTSEVSANNKTNLGALISGKAAVEFTNIIVPSSSTFILRKAGYDMDKKDLQFNANEKEILAPYFQEWLNSLNIDLNNPLYNLLLGLGIVYSSKFMDKGESIKKIHKEKPMPITQLKKEYQKPKEQVKVEPIVKEKYQRVVTDNSFEVRPSEDIQLNESDQENLNLFEQMMEKENKKKRNVSPEQQLIKDTMKGRKCSRVKAIEWLQNKGALRLDYSE